MVYVITAGFLVGQGRKHSSLVSLFSSINQNSFRYYRASVATIINLSIAVDFCGYSSGTKLDRDPKLDFGSFWFGRSHFFAVVIPTGLAIFFKALWLGLLVIEFDYGYD